MNKTLQYAVRFARFCAETGLDPRDVAELVRLAERRARAVERETWGHQYGGQEERANDRLVVEAFNLGIEVRYPGLYADVRLPGKWDWRALPIF